MSQKIVFNCKWKDEKGNPCQETVLFKPKVVVTYKMMEGGRVAPGAPVVYGEVAPTHLTCKQQHGFMYDVVKFKCAEPGCKHIVVCTTETKPVYEGKKSIEEGKKIKLTCDEGHEHEYELE